MLGYHRRRSPLKLVLWWGSFLALSLLLAWRFEWLPGSGNEESPLEPDSTVNLDPKAPRNSVPAKTANDPFDPSVFSHQTEPGGRGNADLRLPARFPSPVPSKTRTLPFDPNVGLKTGSSGTRKTHGMRPVGLGIPTVDFPAGNQSGISLAGHQRVIIGDDAAPPPQTLRKIDGLLSAGEYLAAHKQLSQIYWNQPQWRNAIRGRIEHDLLRSLAAFSAALCRAAG